MELTETYAGRAIHETWESVYRTSASQDKLNDRIMDRIIGLCRPGPGCLVLDAGCGVGDHAIRMARRGLRCTGVDISETILDTARANTAREALTDRVSYQSEKLEQLSFPDEHFDLVHCRGVLMHIPEWERALLELVRVLKKGGRLILIEANMTSLETCLVNVVRTVSRRKSRLVKTPGGLEFWSDLGGKPFVARIANIASISRVLGHSHMRVISRAATEFWDINRFPPGQIRGGVIAFNRIWFWLRLPPALSAGNVIVAEKLRPAD
jgi:ubiquinone/menaquinone biosynthesis C-methylase UbiE